MVVTLFCGSVVKAHVWGVRLVLYSALLVRVIGGNWDWSVERRFGWKQ